MKERTESGNCGHFILQGIQNDWIWAGAAGRVSSVSYFRIFLLRVVYATFHVASGGTEVVTVKILLEQLD